MAMMVMVMGSDELTAQAANYIGALVRPLRIVHCHLTCALNDYM